jgi:hypothetical protein
MAEEERPEEKPDERLDGEPEGGGETGDVARIVSEHAEGDERFESEMREFMKHIDAKISQLADAQAAIVSTARIDDNDADEDEHGNDAMDDGVLDLIIND